MKRSGREGPWPDKLSARIRSAIQGRSRPLETKPQPVVAETPGPAPKEWNLWDLERKAREPGGYAIRDAEWAALFIHLREFATAEGTLPKEFDELVRQSFAELIQAA